MSTFLEDLIALLRQPDTLPLLVGFLVVSITVYFRFLARKENDDPATEPEATDAPEARDDEGHATEDTNAKSSLSDESSTTAPTKATHPCAVCKSPATSRCVGCKKVYYCSVQHQKQDWKVHQHTCALPKKPAQTSTPTPASDSSPAAEQETPKAEAPKQQKEPRQHTPQIVKPAIPFRDSPCVVCHKTVTNAKRCSKCKKVFYCSVEHQKQDWKVHKKNCEAIPSVDLSYPWILRVNISIEDILIDAFNYTAKYLNFPFGPGQIHSFHEYPNNNTLTWVNTSDSPAFSSVMKQPPMSWNHSSLAESLEGEENKEKIIRAYYSLLMAGRSQAFTKTASVLMVMLQRSGKTLVYKDQVIEDLFVAEGTVQTPSLAVVSAANSEHLDKFLAALEQQAGWSHLDIPSEEQPHVLDTNSVYQTRVIKSDAEYASISVLPAETREQFIVCRSHDGTQYVLDLSCLSDPSKASFNGTSLVPKPYLLTDSDPCSDLLEITNSRDVVSDLAHTASSGIAPGTSLWDKSIATAYIYALEDVLLKYPVSSPEGFLNVAIRPLKERILNPMELSGTGEEGQEDSPFEAGAGDVDN